jgi:methyltransferase (TIGR00027 family)
MMSPVGLTSRWVAANRAREAETPSPLFDDPYARALAGDEGFAVLAASQKVKPVANDGPDPYLSIRTRFFDDALLRAVNEQGIRQVAILAAGMDSRAFRLAWPEGTKVFEIDRGEVSGCKEPILWSMGAKPRCARYLVPVDLEHDWINPLLLVGFDRDKPAAFLVEGLLMYLDPATVPSLLSVLSRIAAPGSWLGMDLVGAAFLSAAQTKAFLAMLEQMGCPWRFGTEEPEKLLAGHGWVARVVVAGEPEANYGRWPYPVAPRNMPGIPRSFLVTAQRMA